MTRRSRLGSLLMNRTDTGASPPSHSSADDSLAAVSESLRTKINGPRHGDLGVAGPGAAFKTIQQKSESSARHWCRKATLRRKTRPPPIGAPPMRWLELSATPVLKTHQRAPLSHAAVIAVSTTGVFYAVGKKG